MITLEQLAQETAQTVLDLDRECCKLLVNLNHPREKEKLVGIVLRALEAAVEPLKALEQELESTLKFYREKGRVTVERDGSLAQRVVASAEIAISKLEIELTQLRAREQRLREALSGLIQEAEYSASSELPFNAMGSEWTQLGKARQVLADTEKGQT